MSLLRFASFYHFYATNHLVFCACETRPFPNLKNNASDFFYTGPFMPLKFSVLAFLSSKKSACPFKSNPLNSTNLHLSYSFCLDPHSRVPQALRCTPNPLGESYDSCFKTPFSSAVVQGSGAGSY
jgi:hypothetical protein